MIRYEISGTEFGILDPDESTTRETLPGNTYEPAVTSIILSALKGKSDGFFIDVGALYGYFAILVAKATGARVLAFEPSHASAAVLRENVRLNGLANVAVEQIALAGERKSIGFKGKTIIAGEAPGSDADEIARGDAGLSQSSPAYAGRKVGFAFWLLSVVRNLARVRAAKREVVHCVPFSDYAAHVAGSPVVVKIDVHGAEVSVLRGMWEFIKDRADVILVELHSDSMLVEGSHEDTVRFLKNTDLDLYEVCDFRSDKKWSTRRLGKEDLEGLKTSSRWSVKDRVTMRMVLGVKKGFCDVEFSGPLAAAS